jgi:hypothetical protein
VGVFSNPSTIVSLAFTFPSCNNKVFISYKNLTLIVKI